VLAEIVDNVPRNSKDSGQFPGAIKGLCLFHAYIISSKCLLVNTFYVRLFAVPKRDAPLFNVKICDVLNAKMGIKPLTWT
jgi:hypothetical protein